MRPNMCLFFLFRLKIESVAKQDVDHHKKQDVLESIHVTVESLKCPVKTVHKVHSHR